MLYSWLMLADIYRKVIARGVIVMDDNTDEILGITRCVNCGHRLEGEVECPFCVAMRGMTSDTRDGGDGIDGAYLLPLWVIVTAIFMSFPLSLPWLFLNRRLTGVQKAALLAACIVWGSSLAIWFI